MTRGGTRAAGITVALAWLAASPFVAGCAALHAAAASNDDLGDFRAFRAAAHPGTRLARADAYLERHPDGAFAAEVRAAFSREEPRYFEAAKRSRQGARDYLVDLPRGPHADAAVALLAVHEAPADDVVTARLVRDARRTEVVLERAAAQRRVVGERLLELVAAVLDRDLYGHPLRDAPAAVQRAVDGPVPRTWGAMPSRRALELFFSVPTVRARESRVVTAALDLDSSAGVVVRARLSGADLFVRWAEADLARPLDAARAEDRLAAGRHVADILAGAFEAKLPGTRCGRPAEAALVARACGGLGAWARMGAGEGAVDTVVVGSEAVVLEVPAPPR